MAEKSAVAIETLDRLASDWHEGPPHRPSGMTRDASSALTTSGRPTHSSSPPPGIVADGEPGALPFVTLDERLAVAASARDSGQRGRVNVRRM